MFGPAGLGLEKGNMEGAKQYRNCQFFTPETRGLDAFLLELPARLRAADPAIGLSLHDSMVQGFLEDKFIIEQQQETLDADPDFKMNGIVSDAPLAPFPQDFEKIYRRGAGQ